MLILTRRETERIELQGAWGVKLGEIVVERVRGNSVKLGFEFHESIRIVRSELKPMDATQGKP